MEISTEPGAGLAAGQMSPAMRSVLGHVFINMPWNFLGRYIDLAIENGISLEIGFGADELESASGDEVSAVVRRIRDKGCDVTMHGPFWDLCSGSVDLGIREVSRSRYNRLLDLADVIHPVRIVCHTGFDPRHHRGHRGTWIENSLSTWETVVGRAEAIAAPLVLENVWEEDPSLHMELLKRIDSPWLGFCLDTGHQHSFSKTSLDKWLDATWPFLKEIHIHDNNGGNDSHLPVGQGTIDFDRLFQFLGEKKISPVLTLEPHTVEHLNATLAGLAAMDSFNDYVRTVRGGTSSNEG